MSYVIPAIEATLNATSGALLITGFVFIKNKKWRAHGYTMVSATVVSAVFLGFYLTYHSIHGDKSTAHTHAPHWLRMIYLVILLPHLLLATAMLPMIYITLARAYRRDWTAHKRMSVPTFWVWLYVSVTGVIIYFMLYHTSLVGMTCTRFGRVTNKSRKYIWLLALFGLIIGQHEHGESEQQH